ncbi:MAG: hypothetical protein U1E27_04190, partial [Kiritimatiellia bacterium]|nr:hypothetical protein [Kiritimatiellia bacterium]
MRAFLLRRLLQTIPTMAGVLLLTFVLFNAVGGSPAGMTLGDRASPQALEEFDEARGFNKPLLIGRFARTRALPDANFSAAQPGWSSLGDPADGFARIDAGRKASLPFRFPLRPGARYRLTLRARGGAGATFQGLELFPDESSKAWKHRQNGFGTVAGVADPGPPLDESAGLDAAGYSKRVATKTSVGVSKDWKTVRLDCVAGGPYEPAPPFHVGAEPLELQELSL